MYNKPVSSSRACRGAASWFSALGRIIRETPHRDRGDGRATGQPSRGTEGLDLRRTCSVRRKVRDPRTPGRTTRSAVGAGGSCIVRPRFHALLVRRSFSEGGCLQPPAQPSSNGAEPPLPCPTTASPLTPEPLSCQIVLTSKILLHALWATDLVKA